MARPVQRPPVAPASPDPIVGAPAPRPRTSPPRSGPARDVRMVALAVPPTDPYWRQRLSLRIAGLHSAFTAHLRLTEGPYGHYAELLADAPRLARGVQILLREHVAVGARFEALCRRVDLPEVGVEELHARVESLIRELSRHRQRGADLLYEAYHTDIGGET